MTDTQTNSQRLQQQAQDVLRFKTDVVSTQRGESGHEFPPLNKKLCLVSNRLLKKNKNK